MKQNRTEILFAAQVKQAGLPTPEPEYRFHPKRRWRFDHAWPDEKLALEIEGGVWTQGRHTRGSGFIGDIEKYNAAALLGWRVLRVPTAWVDGSEKALELVREALNGRSE